MPTPYILQPTAKSGFTLIEVVITVAIMVVLVAVTMVNFNNFNAKQQVETSVQGAKAFIKIAQRKAQAQDTPLACNHFDPDNPVPLQAYRVISTDTTLTMQANCGPINDPEGLYGQIDTFVLPPDVQFDENFDMRFFVLYGGAQNIGGSEISISKGEYKYAFSVLETGEITEGSWVEL